MVGINFVVLAWSELAGWKRARYQCSRSGFGRFLCGCCGGEKNQTFWIAYNRLMFFLACVAVIMVFIERPPEHISNSAVAAKLASWASIDAKLTNLTSEGHFTPEQLALIQSFAPQADDMTHNWTFWGKNHLSFLLSPPPLSSSSLCLPVCLPVCTNLMVLLHRVTLLHVNARKHCGIRIVCAEDAGRARHVSAA
jgi:hypothetical protein